MQSISTSDMEQDVSTAKFVAPSVSYPSVPYPTGPYPSIPYPTGPSIPTGPFPSAPYPPRSFSGEYSSFEAIQIDDQEI
jgi:hypothetical protein